MSPDFARGSINMRVALVALLLAPTRSDERAFDHSAECRAHARSSPGPNEPRAAPPDGRARRPDIVLIIADDMGFSELEFMPRTAALQARATKLSRHYVTPQCTTTRAALLTGRHPSRYGAQENSISPWSRFGIPLDETFLSQRLRGLGYYTAHFGKWHLGHGYLEYLPTHRGFDHSFGHLYGAINYWKKTPRPRLAPDWQRDAVDVGGDNYVQTTYSTHLIVTDALDVIARRTADAGTQPLFLYVAFNAVHQPLSAPPCANATAPDGGGCPRYRRVSKNQHECDVKARAFAEMDVGVTRLVDALTRARDADNLFVLFSSDNGATTACANANRPLRGYKGELLEGGVRVPAFAMWPRVRFDAPPPEIELPVAVTDWYPTLLALAGGAPERADDAKERDGHDLSALIDGHDSAPFDNRTITLGLQQHGSALLTVEPAHAEPLSPQ